MDRTVKLLSIFASIGALILSGAAQAYIGPGAGISAIGSLLALVGAVLLAIVGFVWYPMKRLMKKRREARNNDAAAAPDDEGG